MICPLNFIPLIGADFTDDEKMKNRCKSIKICMWDKKFDTKTLVYLFCLKFETLPKIAINHLHNNGFFDLF